ncbi:MAG: VOC family protein [Bacteroidota bacterium]|nr:VOC family protein [Bacteroidota bacterium]
MGIRFRNVILLTSDIEKSKNFYCNIIGLSIKQDFKTFVLFEGNFSIHTADLFYEYIDKQYHGEKMGQNNLDLYFSTSDLLSMQEKLKDAGIPFIHEIRKQAWGESIIRIYDPDGHIVEIGDAD